MKAKYLMLFLILILVSNLGLGCSSSEIKEEVMVAKPISETIYVRYVVMGYPASEIVNPEVSVTYNNSQGGTEQKNGLILKENSELILGDTVKGFNFEVLKDWRAEIIAEYNYFPRDEFLYISAQNQKDYGLIRVIIVVNDSIWKSGNCEGEYCIVDASGYYDK